MSQLCMQMYVHDDAQHQFDYVLYINDGRWREGNEQSIPPIAR